MLVIQPVADRVIARAFENGVDTLSTSERVFFFVWCYAVEVSNGGHAQFFFNSGCDYTPETIEALNQIGLARFASFLKDAAAASFGKAIPRTQDARNQIIDAVPEAVAAKIEQIDRAFFEYGGDDTIYQQLAKWYGAQPAA